MLFYVQINKEHCCVWRAGWDYLGVNCNTNYKKGGGNYVLKHCSTVSWATYCATFENITQQTTNIKPSTTHAQHRNRSDNTSHVHNKAILSTNEVAHQIWSQPVNSHRCWITFPLTTGGSTWLFATFQIARLCPLIQVVGGCRQPTCLAQRVHSIWCHCI